MGGFAAAGAAIVGAVVSVAGMAQAGAARADQAQAAAAAQEQQAQAQNEAQNSAAQQAMYQAQVATNNAATAKQNQMTAERAAATQAQIESMKSAQAQGQIRAAAAAGGLDPNTGTPLAVAEGARSTGQQSTLNTYNNAMLTAYGYQTAATNYQADAGLYGQQAQQDKIAGKYDLAGGQLAVNAGNVAAGNDIMGGVLGGLGTGFTDASKIISTSWSGGDGSGVAVDNLMAADDGIP